MALPRSARHVGVMLILTFTYFVAAKLGLSLALVNPSATAIWPPTGIAIGATLLLGRRALPGVFLGAFLANLTTSGTIATSLGIATGNTLEALVAAFLIRKHASGRFAFERPRELLLVGFIVAISALVSASLGVLTLLAGGLAPMGSAGAIWLTWWLGDALGALVFAPPIILWANRPRPGWSARGALEASLTLGATIAASIAIFGAPGIEPLRDRLPLGFALIPFVLYAAVRLGARDAATIALAISGITWYGTLQGHGPFATTDANASLLFVQGYIALITLLALLVGTLVEEHRRAGEALERAVAERTRDLTEAQRIAKLGSWTYDPDADQLAMSDELPRLYGFGRAAFPTTFASIAALTHPEDQDRATDAVSSAIEARAPFQVEYRIVRGDGDVRTLHAQGEVTHSADGRTLVRGTTQDVTDLRASEARLRSFLEAAPDAIIVADAEGRMTLVNQQAERIFGYSRDEMLGQPVEMLIPASSREKHPSYREHYFAAPRARPMGAGLPLRARRKDGSEFPVEISLSPIETADGMRVMSAIRDTTQKQRAKRMEREQFVTKKLVRRMLRHEGIAGGGAGLRRDLGRQMANETGGREIAEYIDAFKAMGLGAVTLVSQQGERYEVHGSDLLEVTPGYHATTCHLTLGFLEGAVAQLTGRDALGAETCCQSQGQQHCTFVVVARPKR